MGETHYKDCSSRPILNMLTNIEILNAFPDEIEEIVPRLINSLTKELQPLKRNLLEIQEQDIDHHIKDIQCDYAIIFSGLSDKIERLKQLKKLYKMHTSRIKSPNSKFSDEKLQIARQYKIEDMYSFEKMRQNGQRLSASCPFHIDKTPSFVIYPNNRFHCFSCQSNGSNIDFFMKLHNLSFKDAIVKLS